MPFRHDDHAISDSLPQPSENLTQYEEIRREFDANGVTRDIDDFFFPSAASTPMVPRKLQYNQEQSFMQHQPKFNGYRNRQMTQRKKFKPNKKSLEDVSRDGIKEFVEIQEFPCGPSPFNFHLHSPALRLLQEQRQGRDHLPFAHRQRRHGAHSLSIAASIPLPNLLPGRGQLTHTQVLSQAAHCHP
jgi:hypothetical protein